MKRQRIWISLIGVLSVFLLVAASCGGGSESDGQSNEASPTGTEQIAASDAPSTKAVDTQSSESESVTSEDVERVELDLADFQFEPSTLNLPAGTLVELTIRNSGNVVHEWMAGRERTTETGEAGYHTDLIALLHPEVVQGHGYQMELMGMGDHHNEMAEAHDDAGGHGTMISSEVEVEPGGEVVLRFQTPSDAAGSWEMGCLLPGHYEAGMKGAVVVGDAAAGEIEPRFPTSGLITAIDYIDSARFHEMSETLAAGEINPRYLSTVEKVIAVTSATHWPTELQPVVETFNGDLNALAEALAAEDVEAAAEAAEAIHYSQHDLSHEVFETLSTGTDNEVSAAGLITAIDYIDSAGFHSMSEDLAAGEINPRFLGTVEKVVAVTNATAWPTSFAESVGAFEADLSALIAGLEAEDVAAAAEAAEAIHASQHDLSHQAFEALGNESLKVDGTTSKAGLIAAIDYIDTAGFHGMAEDLAAGEINPRYLSTVEKVMAVTNATAWPADLDDAVEAFRSDLQALIDALANEDVDVAAEAGEAIHASQHDLSHGVFADLSGQHDDGYADSGDVQQVSLEITDWSFSGDLEVKQGTVTLTVTNNGRMPHGLYMPEFKINESIAAGETVTITFEADMPGTYRFLCNDPMCGTAEQHVGMQANLIVE